ncbi:MAG: branched-chain amino acid ABC transporter permease [Hyphomicrobiales bacterium]|nr:branched-chain amino acid ABC transporter permease [Hyphomicrobiales bacterium]MBV8286115.1 branched-chain amino acid ABC transporter permease [Hyphomicrobiales bacterium]
MSASFDPSARLRAAVHPVTLLVVAALIVLPWVEPDKFTLHILSLIAIASIAAMGLQVLLGYSGQLSIGQAAFYGIGAYTSALLTARLGVPFPLALIGAGAAAAIASLLMVPITRLTGAYLAVATLGFSIIVFLFIQNEEWLTGGSYGFIGIPRAELFGYALRDPMWSYYLNVGMAAIVYFTFARIAGSRFGRAINAIRQDADAARASGIRVTLLKSECFVIAAFVAGLAGSLYAHEVRYLAPNDFTFWKSIEMLIMVVIGGVGSLAGAILGAAVVVGLPEYLRAIGDYRMLVFGAILIATMLFGEGGLAALFATLGRRVSAVAMRSAPKLPPGNEAAR